MPDRFDLTFINKEGKEERPVVIHRSSIGCLERTIAFLIEKFMGAFPLWLSPVQVIVLPISEKQADYAEKVYKELKNSGIRTELDASNESLGKRIREAKMQKVPYIVVVGDKEKKLKTLTIEVREGEKLENITSAEFLVKLKDKIENKK
jgi:threonyl-tRNA synthetase